MFEYPNILDNIFDKLNKHQIKPIIVGGYVRDYFLNITSKDIDIELYGIDSLDKLEKILGEFGSVNSVGKSFGVVKLKYKDLDLDFSLPRRDSKVALGHKGFSIEVDTTLDFTEAASRRDFTINAMGYDIVNKKLLDPYKGKEDLKNSLLRAVDLEKFGDDPLRVLRAVSFASRFNLNIEETLLQKCKEMISKNVLDELPAERVYGEIEKILLKSPKISTAFKLLHSFGAFNYFNEFQSLSSDEFEEILEALDRYSNSNKKERDIALMLALLTSKFSSSQTESFLKKLTTNKSLLQQITTLHSIKFESEKFSDYSLYILATQVNIELFYLYRKALGDNNIDKVKKRAEELTILKNKLPPLIEGKDLITLGLKPSKEFSVILKNIYDMQLKGKVRNKNEALKWLQENLLS